VALYALLDERLVLTVRLVSGAMAIAHAAHAWSAISAGPEWRTTWNRRWLSIVTSSALVAGLVVNVVIGDVGLLQLLFVALVAGPASVFLATVRDASRGLLESADDD
jgi:hypothetical protein